MIPTPAESEGRDREARTDCLRGTTINNYGGVMSILKNGRRRWEGTYHDRYRPVFLHFNQQWAFTGRGWPLLGGYISDMTLSPAE
jgi:hypothetical protein